MIDIAEQKKRLQQKGAELLSRYGRLSEDATATHSADWSEQAQERMNDEVVDALGNEARVQLLLVEKALERIDAGIYGQCVGCQGQVAEERLKVQPEAALCMPCAQAREFAGARS